MPQGQQGPQARSSIWPANGNFCTGRKIEAKSGPGRAETSKVQDPKTKVKPGSSIAAELTLIMLPNIRLEVFSLVWRVGAASNFARSDVLSGA